MKFSIYTLTNPKNDKVFYIGSTRDLFMRATCHTWTTISKAYGHSEKDRYIIEMGVSPIVEIIDEVEGDESTGMHCNMPINVHELEAFWIMLFKSWGFELVNRRWLGKHSKINSKKYRALRSKQLVA